MSDKKGKYADWVDKLNKKHGNNSVMNMNHYVNEGYDSITSGSLSFDIASGVGGLVWGRIYEFYGEPSSGKTSQALISLGQAQKKGNSTLYIDMEHAVDPNWAEALGVDLDEFYLAQPDSGNQALDILQSALELGVKFIVVDSVAALIPQAELDGDAGDSNMGLQARLVNQAMRRITPIVNKNKSIIIFINQVRHKIGVHFGSPETTPGGKGLPFAASVRVRFSGKAITKKKEKIGSLITFDFKKNKLAPPFKKKSSTLYFGLEEVRGIFYQEELILAAVDLGIVSKGKGGGWLTYKEDTWNGTMNAGLAIAEDLDLKDEIEALVLAEYGIKKTSE